MHRCLDDSVLFAAAIHFSRPTAGCRPVAHERPLRRCDPPQREMDAPSSDRKWPRRGGGRRRGGSRSRPSGRGERVHLGAQRLFFAHAMTPRPHHRYPRFGEGGTVGTMALPRVTRPCVPRSMPAKRCPCRLIEDALGSAARGKPSERCFRLDGALVEQTMVEPLRQRWALSLHAGQPRSVRYRRRSSPCSRREKGSWPVRAHRVPVRSRYAVQGRRVRRR